MSGSRILRDEGERCDCDFHSLSYTEIEIFDIDPKLRDELADAYWRYEAMIGCIDTDGDGWTREEDRTRFPEYLKRDAEGRPIISHVDAVQFMARAAKLPVAQCGRWVLKVQALEHRRGLICYNEPRP
ncbi:MAG: hypothetical protein ABL871_16885 [Terricaulis sp.]